MEVCNIVTILESSPILLFGQIHFAPPPGAPAVLFSLTIHFCSFSSLAFKKNISNSCKSTYFTWWYWCVLLGELAVCLYCTYRPCSVGEELAQMFLQTFGSRLVFTGSQVPADAYAQHYSPKNQQWRRPHGASVDLMYPMAWEMTWSWFSAEDVPVKCRVLTGMDSS